MAQGPARRPGKKHAQECVELDIAGQNSVAELASPFLLFLGLVVVLLKGASQHRLVPVLAWVAYYVHENPGAVGVCPLAWETPALHACSAQLRPTLKVSSATSHGCPTVQGDD